MFRVAGFVEQVWKPFIWLPHSASDFRLASASLTGGPEGLQSPSQFMRPRERWILHRRMSLASSVRHIASACSCVTKPDGTRVALCRPQPVRSTPIVFRDHQRPGCLRLPIDRSTGQEISQLIPVPSFEKGPIRIGHAGVSGNRSDDEEPGGSGKVVFCIAGRC